MMRVWLAIFTLSLVGSFGLGLIGLATYVLTGRWLSKASTVILAIVICLSVGVMGAIIMAPLSPWPGT